MRPLILALALLAPLACSRAKEAGPTPPPATRSVPAPEAAPPAAAPSQNGAATATAPEVTPTREAWTTGDTEVVREGTSITMNGIRAAKNDGFDRIVFQFAGDALPGYRVEYIDPPAHHCGSGNPLEIAGDGLLEVSMSPTVAHDEEGNLTIASQELKPALPVVLELGQSCDFEGVVSFVAGVRAANGYRVLELKDPARLVIDVRH